MPQELNEVQQRAVNDNDGPMIIEAAAGSGKTRVITNKVSKLIRDGVSPGNILCVTFTRNAAREMMNRLEYLLGETVSSGIWIETFHGLCLRIMSEYGVRLGYKPGFTVYDESDTIDIMKEVLKDLNINLNARNESLRIHKARLEDEVDPVMVEYLARLKRANAVDFTGLIINATKIIEKFDDVRAHYEFKFRYIMIDEYQDINDHQYNLISKIWGKWRNVCVVGDPRQTIFSFQGANINHIKDFKKDFPESSSVNLNINYRSSEQVVNAANVLIKNNNGGFEDMVSDRGIGRDDISYKELSNEYEECMWIANKVKSIVENNRFINYCDIAILYRMHSLQPMISQYLNKAEIPNSIVSSGSHFFKLEEVLRFMDWLKLGVNYDDGLAFNRVMNIPNRNISWIDFIKIESQASSFDISIIDSAIKFFKDKRVDYGWINTVKEFNGIGLLASAKIVKDLLVDFYNSKNLSTKSLNCVKTYELIKRWYSSNGDSIDGFLDEVSDFKVSKEEMVVEEDNAVKLMTIHAAKGLEFPVVIIPGLESGVFPVAYGNDEIQEERRLFYVGMTRARDKLILSSVRERNRHGRTNKQKTSPFIKEIDIYERQN
jgi:DNA helicase-2/ATP-dependent DNA helicase PcrA